LYKKLLALAVAAAISAPVFAADDSRVNVSVYGNLDVGFGYTSKTVTNPPTTFGNPNGTVKYNLSAFELSALTPSYLGFLATEEMDGGIKAALRVETAISSSPLAGISQTGAAAPGPNGTQPQNDPTTLGNRELNLSLVFNESTIVKVGYGSTPVRDISLGYAADPGGNLIGNLLNNDVDLSSNRAFSLDVTQQITSAWKVTGSLVKYKSSSALNYPAPGTVGGLTYDNKGYQLAVQYGIGPFSVAGAFQNIKISSSFNNFGTPWAQTSDASQKIFILGASIDLGAAKLYGEHASIWNDGLYSQTVLPNGVDAVQPLQVGNGTRTYTSVGVQAPWGAVTIFAQLGMGSVKRVTTLGSAADSRNITGSTLGAKYNLSKVTFAYMSLGQTNMKAGSVDPAAVGIKVSQFALGLVHTF
jgi:predicted porin